MIALAYVACLLVSVVALAVITRPRKVPVQHRPESVTVSVDVGGRTYTGRLDLAV